MPELPEVYALSKSLNKIGFNTDVYGKHLIFHNKNNDKIEDWSFGLEGTVYLKNKDDIHNNNKNNKNKKIKELKDINLDEIELIKIEHNAFSGDKKEYDNINEFINDRNLGINWLTAKENDLIPIVEKWQNSRKMLGPLIIEQDKIAGIGLAWGSEILNNAELLPNVSAKLQDLTTLPESIIYTRDKILETYDSYIKNNNPVEIINGWFRNLYKIREMNVYKVGTTVRVYSRDWWID